MLAKDGPKGPRQIALQVLRAVEVEGAYVHIALDNELQRSGLERRDRGLVTELVYGTLRRRLTIDWVLDQFSRHALEKMPALLRNNLRMALYQIMFLDNILPAIACNEAVELAKAVGHKGTVSLVNGVLRAILREPGKADYVKAAKGMERAQAISLVHSHPLWLVNTWIKELGPEATEQLCAANNIAPPTFFRANTLRTTRDELLAELAETGLTVSPGLLAPEAIRVLAPSAVSHLASFRAGHFSIQDEAAMLVGHALAPGPGELVYDLCAGLGGKTLHLAALMENQGQIMAFDTHGGKLQALGKMAKRLGVTNIQQIQADATNLPGKYLGRAKRVLLDAPCTGWGVLRRKPDIRWRIQPEQSQGLVLLQRQLLKMAYQCLAPGGRLVYSTCTINQAENQENVLWLQRNHPDLRLIEAQGQLPVEARGYIDGDSPMLQLLPHRHGTDGFFIAILQKD